MTLAWTEYLRAQIERPLGQRDPWFAVISVVLLFPLSLLWSSLAALRARRRRKLLAHSSAEPYVVSIGNVAVGGTGKSPVVRAIARLAFQSGYDVAVFTRGVGQTQNEHLLCHAESALEGLSTSAWERLSDETLEHFLQLQVVLPAGAKLWIAQGPRRSELFKNLLAAREADPAREFSEKKRPLFVLVDDGLQQTSLPVHRDVVLWDPDSLVSAPRFALPFGPYRAGWPFARPWAKSLPPADVLVWSRMLSLAHKNQFDGQVKAALMELFATDASRPELSVGRLGQSLQCTAVERTWLARVLLKEPAPGFALETFEIERLPTEVTLLCGIARPERFEKSFLDLCAQAHHKPRIRDFVRFADHGAFKFPPGVAPDAHLAVVTTLKDVCRWWSAHEFKELIRSRHLFVLCLETDLISAEAGWSEIEFESFCTGAKEQVNHD
jgi:tetraacyldisaccharide-1-P 4'-kinase